MNRRSILVKMSIVVFLLLFLVACKFDNAIKKTYDLDIQVEGKGFIFPLNGPYEEGCTLTLDIIPNRGWVFSRWMGQDCQDLVLLDDFWHLLMNSDKEIVAVFVQEDIARFTLTATTSGGGRITKNPDYLDYSLGTEVALTASADSGWRFKEWVGDASGASKDIKLVIDDHKYVQAIFERQPTGNSAEISGVIKISHDWPHPYAKNNGLLTPRETIGKIPVLNSLGTNDSSYFTADYAEGELIVGFDGFRLLNTQEELEVLEAAGCKIDYERSIPELNAYLIKVDERDINKEMERLGALNGVSYVERNGLARILSTKTPNDQYYPYQWHYEQVRLPHAWSVTTGSKYVRLAVLDTGLNTNHPDLQGQFDASVGWNFNGNNADFMDRQGHGTHCAGTIGAVTNNGRGVAGVMWETTIIPVKVLDDYGSGYFSDIARGIMYAAGALTSKPLANPAHIISMSLGGGSSNTTLHNACKTAVDNGVLVIAAAGNDNGLVGYPARYPEVIAVGSTNYNYPGRPERARYSSYGPELDVMCPGGDTNVDSDKDGFSDGVLSTTGNAYQFFQGTSMACPHAAGIAGLMLANGIASSEVRTVLRHTAMDLGGGEFSNQFGYGLVNAYWAVNNVNKIKILVGQQFGDRIEAVAEGLVDLRSTSYNLSGIPSGDYQVFAWIDVQDTGRIDPGDYLFASETMTFYDGQEIKINLELKEVK